MRGWRLATTRLLFLLGVHSRDGCSRGSLGCVTVRSKRADDVPGCVQALAEVHDRDAYPTRWPADPAKWLNPAHLLAAWVAVDNGAVGGHIGVVAGVEDEQLIEAAGRPSEELAMVSRLFVRPAARGQRLGEQMLSTATAFAAQHQLGLVLDVVDDGRTTATQLYERLGWRMVGRRSAGWITPAGTRPQLRLYVLPADHA